jgi:hypothetical protein
MAALRNVVRPTKALLETAATHCQRFEWEDMDRGRPDLGQCFERDVLCRFSDPDDYYYCEGKPELGWSQSIGPDNRGGIRFSAFLLLSFSCPDR